MSQDFQVFGRNDKALFTLKLHRGDGMVLIAMNWKKGKPPTDFVGFAIEYKIPGGDRFFNVRNRLAFSGPGGKVVPGKLPTKLAPIQKFRWAYFPHEADLDGDFTFRVTPVFMNPTDELNYGEPQEAALELRRETHPGQLNVTFTRGFISSQAFVDNFGGEAGLRQLMPKDAEAGFDFAPTHPQADAALAWMGFEARSAILQVLDEALADKSSKVSVVAYDLNEPGIIKRLEKLGKRLRILIDDDGSHGPATSSESRAAALLAKSAGAANVKRQHLGKLQHNKTIVVDGPKVQAAVCGSTNKSWRGFFVQNNNAIVLRGKSVVKVFSDAFANYWDHGDAVAKFGASPSAQWNDLGLLGIDAQVNFSPRATGKGILQSIADDVANHTKSSLFFSLAFLYQTPGAMLDAFKKIQKDKRIFSYGISDHLVKGLAEDGSGEAAGLDLQKPNGQLTVISPAALAGKVPEPFKSEPTGGGGTRMHHKFIVIDFDQPTARVYMGSYNFSKAADLSNGENLLLIRDRRVAVSYMVEALRIFDHHHFRIAQQEAKTAKKTLQLARPPRSPGEKPWWAEDYTDARKIRDRELFAAP